MMGFAFCTHELNFQKLGFETVELQLKYAVATRNNNKYITTLE